MKILLTDDDATVATIMKAALRRAGWTVVWEKNGRLGLEAYDRDTFDAVLVDWMMPELDGIGMIEKLRARRNVPPLIMVTAVSNDRAREHALASGADDFLVKPVRPSELAAVVSRAVARKQSEAPAPAQANAKPSPTRRLKPVSPRKPPTTSAAPKPKPKPAARPATPRRPSRSSDLNVLAIAASTGGPPALTGLLKSLVLPPKTAVVIVVHGPAWMHESLASQLDRQTNHRTSVAMDGAALAPGHVYLAGQGMHLLLEGPPLAFRIDDGPEEHFTRPAADPLFRSVAKHVGSKGVGLVMTGIGRDGADGARAIREAGGRIVVQSPDSSVAPGMPRSALAQVEDAAVSDLSDLHDAVSRALLGL